MKIQLKFGPPSVPIKQIIPFAKSTYSSLFISGHKALVSVNNFVITGKIDK